MGVRYKFRCRSIDLVPSNSHDPVERWRVILDEPILSHSDGPVEAWWVNLNRRTPTVELELVLDDPKTVVRLKVGGMYLVDLIPVD